MSKDNITRRISIFVNGQEVENSLKQIDGATVRLRNQLRLLDLSTEEGRKKFAELKPEYDKAREAQEKYREELGLTTKAMDDGAGSFAKFKDGLLSGDFKSAKEGLSGIRGEITNLIKTSLAFIATPLGAAIAVLSGIVIGTKYLFDFNKELEKSNQTLRAFGVSAEVMSAVRSEIQATADTFDKEFDEIAEKANSLSKSYGISISEANAIIAQGLVEGGAKNNEFLDSIGEYDEFFSKAGYSATEFIDLINKGYDVGIYSDKLPDALKEADLALKEQTKASRDALENAFGASFSDSILARVSSGTITTKQALQEIAAQAKITGLSQQQQAQLTADIFKGAGEDAGGALKILEVVGNTAKKELDGAQKAQLQLLEANEKLNKSLAGLFEIEGFGGMWDVIKAQATTALADIITYLGDLKQDIQPLIDLVSVVLVGAWIYLKFTVVSAFDIIGAVVKGFFDYLKFGFNFIKAVITGDFKGAINLLKNYFISLGDSVGNIFAKIKNNIINAIQGIVSNISPVLTALGFDVDKIQKKLESFKSKIITVKTNTDPSGKNPDNPEPGNTKILADELAKQKALRDAARQKEADARKAAADKKKAEQDKAAKEELDKALALAKAKGDLAKAELAYFIATNASKLDSTQKLTPAIIEDETTRLDAIKDKQLNALAEDRLAKLEKADADKKSDEELVALKQIIDLDYETNRQNLELGFQASTDALKKQYIEEQKVLEAEQLLADNELALAEADTKEQEDAIKRQQDYAKQLAGYKKLFDDKKITEEEYERFKAAAKVKQDDMDRVAQIQKVQGTLGGLNQLAGAVTELFGQSKEMALVQAGINGAMAVTSILAQYPKFDGGFAMAAAIAAAGISTIAQVAKIAKAKPAKTPKFFYGGDTGNFPTLGHDEFGAITGMVHDGEYVIPKAMRQSPRYANTIAWLESERTGKRTRKFFDGGDTSSNAIPDPVMNENSSEMKSLLLAVLFRLENPVAPKLNFGYQDAKEVQNLNDERNQSTSNGIISE